MKKFYFILALLLVSFTAAAAQDLKGIKIYINPGHGGHDSDDRFISETGFWESEGNLTKGFYLRDILQSLGAEVYMSRVANTTADDLPLSQISADANSKNVHFFHSIHSNATGTTNKANYTLLLYKEDSNTRLPAFAQSKEMSDIMAPEITASNRTTSGKVFGDWSFYNPPFNLGVLKNLAMPGALSEGSFHDYYPESWRLKSDGYLKNEAWAIARSFLTLYQKPALAHGVIAGIVRDKNFTVSYTTLTTNDKYKPMNKVKVTLQPGNVVYTTDSLNNGYYMFDKVMPGAYKVIFESAGFRKDTVEVTAVANKVVFADKFLEVDKTIAPSVIAYEPMTSGSTDSVKTSSAIRISFNIPMDQASVESAFSVTPATEGSFVWENDKTVKFVPANALKGASSYKVTVAQSAKSIYMVAMGKEFTFSFVTSYRDRLRLVASYPANKQTEISQTVKFSLTFDAPMASTGFYSSAEILGPDNSAFTLLNVTAATAGNYGIITFMLKEKLSVDTRYRMILKSSLKDKEGFPLGETQEIEFFTTSEQYVSGSIVDSLEAIGTWKRPGLSSGSVGIDSAASSAVVSSTLAYRGKTSGRFMFSFSGDKDGLARFYNTVPMNIPVNDGSTFGIWVRGDMSLTALEFWFSAENGGTLKVPAGIVDWTGWKLVKVPMTFAAGNKNISFHSFVVKQQPGSLKSSYLGVDDIQFDVKVVTDVIGENRTERLPAGYYLAQNYPNPFNPSTMISFSIPEAVGISLKVYNVLGDEVAVLFNNQEMNAGEHSAQFDASGLPSGIYFLKLQAGRYSQTRKMMLLK